MPKEKLKNYLNENGVKYVTVQHSPAFTALEVAESAHIPGKEMIKSVIVKVDDELVMVVVSSSEHVDCGVISKLEDGKTVFLAEEEDFSARFLDCEVGAMPPFGNLYDMKVYLSPALSKDEEIAFNACSHCELIRMKYEDFERLVKPYTLLPE